MTAVAMHRGASTEPERFDAFGFNERRYDRHIRFWERYYRRWLRIRTEGLEHVPDHGPVLLVGNHCGLSALDGIMLRVALRRHHPARRPVRALHHVGMTLHPVWGHLARAAGSVPGHPRNAEYLLGKGEVVLTYPEGGHSTDKRWADRNQLCPPERFGDGFVRLALATGATVLPVASCGFDAAVPTIFHSRLLGRLHGMQGGRMPVSPQMLVLPPLAMLLPLGVRYVPLPVPCRTRIGAPVELRALAPGGAVRDSGDVRAVASAFRDLLQAEVDALARGAVGRPSNLANPPSSLHLGEANDTEQEP